MQDNFKQKYIDQQICDKLGFWQIRFVILTIKTEIISILMHFILGESNIMMVNSTSKKKNARIQGLKLMVFLNVVTFFFRYPMRKYINKTERRNPDNPIIINTELSM